MTILAVVPARGQSKRLPGKNIRPLARKPLLAWTIDAARGIPEIEEILVSTDDPAIADVARSNGAAVPWLRPAELATDTARSADVALHALDWYEQHVQRPMDGLLLLQPTSPFRTPQTIRGAIDLFNRRARRAVVAVSPAQDHPAWTLAIERETLVPFFAGPAVEARSQDLAPCYVVNGCVYLVAPAELRRTRSFAATGATPLVIASPKERLDIDTPWDWQLAEWMAERTDAVGQNT
jgi:CMP-N,N'-diacetyllegionaminic acid synthase